MAKKNRAFQGIPEESICTSKWKGMSQIYDMVRKKAEQLIDEKKTLSPASKDIKSKGRSSPAKDQITDKGKPKVGETADQDTVKIETKGQHGGLDEKETLFRQHMDSDVGNDPSLSNQSGSVSEGSGNSKSLLGKRKFRETKTQFIRLIDLYSPAELGTFTFKVQFWNGGINVTHEDVNQPDK